MQLLHELLAGLGWGRGTAPGESDAGDQRTRWLVHTSDGTYLEVKADAAAAAGKLGALVRAVDSGDFLSSVASLLDAHSCADYPGAGEFGVPGLRVMQVSGETLTAGLVPSSLFASGTTTAQELIANGLDVDYAQHPDRPNRILVLIHGTFSSTGSYLHDYAGAPPNDLTDPDQPGVDLLQACQGQYRTVVGFTHFTRSVLPSANAQLIAGGLQQLMSALAQSQGKGMPTIDIICHSRGGLVTRELTEGDALAAEYQSQIRQVVFVATPSAGTSLAIPVNVVDWLMSDDEALNWLFDKFPALKASVVERFGHLETRWDGVACMEPGCDFLTGLQQNLVQARGDQLPAGMRYYTVSGRLYPTDARDGIFLVANDNTVNTVSVLGLSEQAEAYTLSGNILPISGALLNTMPDDPEMAAIGSALSGLLQDKLVLMQRPDVTHSSYFRTPEYRQFVADVLGVTLG